MEVNFIFQLNIKSYSKLPDEPIDLILLSIIIVRELNLLNPPLSMQTFQLVELKGNHKPVIISIHKLSIRFIAFNLHIPDVYQI